MENDDQPQMCIRFLRNLRNKGRSYAEFRTSINILQAEASTNGLNDDTFQLLMEVVKHLDLNASTNISLIKCMIPKNKVDNTIAKKFIAWILKVPSTVTVVTMLLQWLIGCWEYQLIDRNSIYIFYDCFFYLMLKEDKLESRIAQLIYLMTKPEDVTRRQVIRLLNLNDHYRRPQKHIIALLSLYKSYKPEFVPEQIPAINIQSIWRPIPEVLLTGFKDTRDRIMLIQSNKTNDLCGNWASFNLLNTKKNQEPLIPSVGYFNMGSNLFNNKLEKSIFDVPSAPQLGKYHSIIRLPCNAASLLTNSIGYHLLTYADLEYQQRFIHNLYYTFWKSFIFENGRFSTQEMNRLLDLTLEFCRFMQHGIPIVNYFINEYLSCHMDSYQDKFLSLMEWSSISVSELQDYVLKHIKLMFYCSSLHTKCDIIKTLRALLLNLYVINDDSFKDKLFPFLNQNISGKTDEVIHTIENVSNELLTAALNIHFYNPVIVSEALSFYELIDALKVYKKTSFIIFAPSPVIYSCFVSKNCAMLSRVCALLLQYRKYFKDHNDKKSMKRLVVYAEDLVSALWYDNCFSNRLANSRYFLKHLSENIVKENPTINIDNCLNICQHYAILPYMYILNVSGLQIKTKIDGKKVAAYYYPHINQFIVAHLGNKT